jgi:LmbE family N-acetylglucosaminyl deacetylase
MRQIVSPHIDDAFLSLGGCISNWLAEGERVKIIYIFTRSSWTNAYPISDKKYTNSIKTITALRKTEESNLQCFTGHDALYLDWYDIDHRGKKSMLDNFLRDRFLPITQSKMVREIENQLIELLDRKAITYFPLAMGKWVHPDHAITNLLGWSLLKKDFNIGIYEDLPHCTHINVEEIIANLAGKVKFTPVYGEIDMDRKIKLLQYYQSQMSHEWLQTVREYGSMLHNETPHERYWVTSS